MLSSLVGINVEVGNAQSSGLRTNSSITLSVSNGRDAIWSGACSSGGNKTATCTFIITGNASVTVEKIASAEYQAGAHDCYRCSLAAEKK